ncbi:amid-like mitochondrial oxidoreductase [Echria macrotheca]|uniref:Amid-like mitochondrial oxidoreductase n=1 Tax=Echria macrotheca TaxID=438768 RepID=A0AAJ0B9A2_9PEZI|nr:amid-like mitochondrial oxidoreductase [Echria macrotheca]
MAKSTDNKKNIIIVGGSYAGVSTAHYLLKHVLPLLDDTHQVLLISSSTQVFSRPACPRAMISDAYFDQAKLFVDLASQFRQYPAASFRFVHAAVTAVTAPSASRTVSFRLLSGDQKGSAESITYHSIVLATGSAAASPLHGLPAGGDVVSLKAAWSAFRAALPAARRIVIAGGGPSGVETAGELGEHLNGRVSSSWIPFVERENKKPKVEIILVTGGERILPFLREDVAARAERYLAALGVRVVKCARVVGVSPPGAGEENDTRVAERASVTLDSGDVLEADLYIPCTGTRANTGYIAERGWLAGDGRVETDPRTLRVERAGAGVYAIGDVSSFARPAIHNITEAVPVLGSVMKRDLLGTGEEREFREDMRKSQFVPVGRSKGVGLAMGWKVPSFIVWLVKGRDYWLWTTPALWSGKQWAKE